jgi:neutral amino acid transport system permease protein
VDWNSIISNTFRSGISQQAIIFALAAIGLNLHFGYTGLLNFGQVAFMAVGAYGVGITTDTIGAPLWVGIIVGHARRCRARPLARSARRCDSEPTISPSSPSRSARSSDMIVRAATLSDITGGSNGINGFANSFQDWNPFTNTATYGFGCSIGYQPRVQRRRRLGTRRRVGPRPVVGRPGVEARQQPVGSCAAFDP